MRAKHVNGLITLFASLLFTFSCFCLYRMSQINNQLTSCRNHVLEFRETMKNLKNKAESNRQELMEAFDQMRNEITMRDKFENSVENKVDTLNQNQKVSNAFEDLKFFFPHLKNAGNVYPNVLIGKGRKDVSFALGIPTINRGSYSYLKQTLTSVLSWMTRSEEEDSVVIVSVADNNEDYLNSVVNMITKKFKRQVNLGFLEVISIPAFLYPDMINAWQFTNDSNTIHSWQMKQVLDFCILMLYSQPKATYYLQLEDDIIAKQMYFTKITDFVRNMSSHDWFCLEFSVLGFIGKLFRSEDLTDIVRFFLMFYKDKPIDALLSEIFHLKTCDTIKYQVTCTQRKKQICVRHNPSLFQHVGIHSSFLGKEQHSKDIYY
ncbi:alpha-1,3-mannosyl-glycoprotein 4-beta-N-acetylglucosaminyltransferase-like protein MGAT4D isoform X1 [Ochotona princeps]|uniref:alpha-1,3-mannosyl-glycoprotein 4-beta-N-acetylglucosaminyltransferase-like protein MGAT4D isoform X1 n=2 Tax=Ochotona princeps TaxID=9978 RepID=UPI0027150C76|nr:alpha-1,3-mannosyl-glycoprotein 4-beta-N-acetylglucosaminyltransferase-like protein MGAT4D isoform X1 [Ochotona princeps]